MTPQLAPSRSSSSRQRRPSEKENQRLTEQQDAVAHKALEAKKAQRREERRREREDACWEDEDEDEGIIGSDDEEETTFTSREVPSKPSTLKNLTVRKSKVPPVVGPLRSVTSSTALSSRTLNQAVRSQIQTPISRGWRGTSSEAPQSHERESFSQRLMINLQNDSIPHPRQTPTRHEAEDFEYEHEIDDEEETDAHRKEEEENEHDIRLSSTVTVGAKRARDDDDSSSNDGGSQSGQTVKARKLWESVGRPKAKDYDDVTQEILSVAIAVYRCLISTDTPFPDHSKELEFVKIAWNIACKKVGLKLEMTPELVKMITSRGSHVRGELKTKVRPIVESYGFESGQHKRTIKANRELAEHLKEGYKFVYQTIGATEASCKGLYRNKNIQKIVNAMWFAKKQDEGVVFYEYFKPFRVVTLALVLTGMECVLDEWSSGIKTEVQFTSVDYRPVYEAHLKCLQDFDRHTKKHELLDKICTRLHNVGRFHSGAQPITPVVTAAVSTNAFAAALKEYEENSETETDGEDGDL